MKKYILRVVSDLGFALIMFVLKLSVRQRNNTEFYIYQYIVRKLIDMNDNKVDELISATQKEQERNSRTRKGC